MALGAELFGFFLIVREADEQFAGFGDILGRPAEIAALIEHRHVEIDAGQMAAGSFGGQDVLDPQIGFFKGGERMADLAPWGAGRRVAGLTPWDGGLSSPGRRSLPGIKLAWVVVAAGVSLVVLTALGAAGTDRAAGTAGADVDRMTGLVIYIRQNSAAMAVLSDEQPWISAVEPADVAAGGGSPSSTPGKRRQIGWQRGNGLARWHASGG